MRLNFPGNSFFFGRINRENAPRAFFMKLERRKFHNASELHGKPLRFWAHKPCTCAHNFFCKTRRQRTSRMRLNFTANQFIFESINRENAHRTFFCKAWMAKTTKMRLNFITNHFVVGRINLDNAPTTFFIELGRWKLLKSFWTSQQTASFLDASIWKMRPELFSKMRPNFTENRFIFGHTNRGIAPTSFSVNLPGRELPECVWISRETALFWDAKIGKMPPELLYKPCKRRIPKMRLNSLYAVTCKRLQSWKYVPYIFENIFKLCFVIFSPMKEIAFKKCKCRFPKFLSAGAQKRCRKCQFSSAQREHWSLQT